MEKLIGLLIFISLLVICIYFLDNGKLTPGSFTTLIIALVICMLAFYGFDRLKELDLRNGRLILEVVQATKEIKEAKENVVETKTKLEALVIKNLGDMSVWHNVYGGDRRSYSTLLDWKNTVKDPITSQLISTEIERVKDDYRVNIMRLNIDGWSVICKPGAIPACSKGYENPEGFLAGNVLDHLSPEKRWDERARAACLLRNIKTAVGKENVNKEIFFEKLIKHMNPEIENSLCVAKMALQTYADLTGFLPNGVFDFEGAVKDWKNRRDEILKINF